jgi:hypothetical protein
MQDIGAAIAAISALVAALSAVYARWQARAAKRANEIALHENRLGVYKGLVRFRAHISAWGTGIKQEEVGAFGEVAELGEFYFSPELGKRLEAIFEDALKLLSSHEEWQQAQQFDVEKARAMVKPMHALMRATRDECYKISNELKVHLRVGAA